MVKSAPSGMLGEEMGNRMGAVRNDAVRGPSAGQATLRRLLGGDPTSDRVSTHVIFGIRYCTYGFSSPELLFPESNGRRTLFFFETFKG